MLNKKGYITGIEIIIICFMLIIITIIPITCHQSIVRKQAIMAKSGVEMLYWDVFWTNPKIQYIQGKITTVNE